MGFRFCRIVYFLSLSTQILSIFFIYEKIIDVKISKFTLALFLSFDAMLFWLQHSVAFCDVTQYTVKSFDSPKKNDFSLCLRQIPCKIHFLPSFVLSARDRNIYTLIHTTTPCRRRHCCCSAGTTSAQGSCVPWLRHNITRRESTRFLGQELCGL